MPVGLVHIGLVEVRARAGREADQEAVHTRDRLERRGRRLGVLPRAHEDDMPDGGAPRGIDAIEGGAYSCHGSASHEMAHDEVYVRSSHDFHECSRHGRSLEAEYRLREQPGSQGGVGAGRVSADPGIYRAQDRCMPLLERGVHAGS